MGLALRHKANTIFTDVLRKPDVLDSREPDGLVRPEEFCHTAGLCKEGGSDIHKKILGAPCLGDRRGSFVQHTLYQFSPPMQLKSSDANWFPIVI